MNEEHNENTEKKVYRERKKRMKHFYNSIRQQIEFYLGDVNLSRDRFFSNLLQESPYIDIETILKCNKIKKFTEDPKDIVIAVEKSSLISVSEDGKKIFRTVPVAPISNADECTIYVEDLPIEVDHEWLKSVFGRFGEIAYVSIPRYKTSHKLKGFAFIQFDSPESAEKALEAFRSLNSCLFNTMEPKELLSIKTFEGEKDVVIRTRGDFNADQLNCVNVGEESDSHTGTGDEEPNIRKRKRKNTSESKETKTEQQRKESESAGTDTETTPKKKSKKMKSDVPDVPDVPTKASDGSDMEKSKDEEQENRPRKRKRKKAKKNEQVQTFGMQILSKNDWKKLRNKYLEEQRKRMHELKYQLRQSREKCDTNEDEEMDTGPSEKAKTSELRVQFTPGVIVKLQLDQPVKNTKHFKNEVKRYADVEYIDVNENSYFAFIRCASNEIANQVIGLNKWPNMTILKGDEEQAYWEKIKNDRKQKFEQNIHTNTRGKNKLMKKAEAAAVRTHIRFD